MSAIRSGSSRRQQRNYSPYARPQPKKSGWSLSSIFSIFNPLKSRSDANDDADMQSESGSESDSTPEREPQTTEQTTPAHTLADVGHRMTRNLSINGRSTTSVASNPFNRPLNLSSTSIPPPRPSSPSSSSHAGPSTLPFPAAPEPSPEKTIEFVAQFLEDKRNGSISGLETDNILSLLRSSSRQLQQTQTQTREPFRFTHSPSPMRGNSPTMSQRHDRSTSPTKMLSRNPNGSYRWDGGGSSKKRNRYVSPAFGARSASEPFVLNPSSTNNTKTDTKRRRVSNSNGDPISQPSGSTATAPKTPRAPTSSRSPGPDPSPTRLANASVPSNMSPSRSTNGSSSTKSNGLTISTSRMSGRFTTPAIPSPLRQTWGQTSPGSTGSSSPDATPQKQTKAANLMAELIKEATPSKKLEISNPYQAASPARPVVGRPKRPRVSGRAKKPVVEEKKEQEPVFTAQAIIEATVPKGSKRSRPTSSLLHTNGTSGTIIEVEEEEHASKKAKPTLVGRGQPSEHVNAPRKDVNMEPPKSESIFKPSPVAQAPVPVPSSFGLSLSTSRPQFAIPKEPSKLRFSYQPDSSPATTPLPSSQPTHTQSQSPAAPATTPFSLPQAVKASTPPPPIPSSDSDPKAAALAVLEQDLPQYDFSRSKVSPAPLSAEATEARLFALAADVATLPNGFDFKIASSSTHVVETSSKPPKSFDWAAAGIKPPTGKWVCSSCNLSHEPPKQAKCPVCEEPQEMPATQPPKVFNWAAAGIKAPQKSTDKWTCSTCGCLSAATATKCGVCEAPR